MNNQPAILMLHRVVPASELATRLVQKPRFEISVEFFDQYLQRLKEDYLFVSLDNLFQRLQNPTSDAWERPLLALTFDDGYSDVLTHALPVMEKYEIPFTVYLTTGYPDGQIFHVSAAIEDWIRQSSTLEWKIKDRVFRYNLSHDTQKSQAFREIEAFVFSKFSSITEIIAALPVDEHQYRAFGLNWEQVKELCSHSLCTPGAHTITHPDLTKLDRDRLQQELVQAKQRIELYSGQTIIHFAYPYGRYNESVVQYAVAAGYKTMTTTHETAILPEKVDFARLPRICVVQNQFDIFSKI